MGFLSPASIAMLLASVAFQMLGLSMLPLTEGVIGYVDENHGLAAAWANSVTMVALLTATIVSVVWRFAL